MKTIFSYLSIAVSLFCCLPTTAFSQRFNNSCRVTLANIDTGKIGQLVVTTREVILRDPILRPTQSNCEILSFAASISVTDENSKSPKEKTKFWGPFNTTGKKLPDSILKLIKENNGPLVKIMVENIRLKANGKEIFASPILIKYTH